MKKVYGDLREKIFFAKNILGSYELEVELRAAWAEYEGIQREISNFGDDFSRAENRRFQGKFEQLKAIESYIRVIIETLKKKYRYTQEEIDDILFGDEYIEDIYEDDGEYIDLEELEALLGRL